MLGETIDSILNQTFKDFELIVVDNYSTDNTEEVVRSYNDKRIRYFKNKNNGLLAVNRNFAIKKSKGDYIAVCDDDDLWMPGKLEKQLAEFEKDKEIGLVCTNGFSFDESGERGGLGKSRNEYFSFEKLLIDNTIACCSVMIKRNILDDVGWFDESQDITTGEDYELWLRIAKKYKIRYISTLLAKYRVHAGALHSTYLYGIKPSEVTKKVYEKLLEKQIIDVELYKRLCDGLNHRILTIKLIDGDKTINVEKILKTRMTTWEKSKVMVIYFLHRTKILNILRRLHIQRNIPHIR